MTLIKDQIALTIRDAEMAVDGISALLLFGEPGVGKTFLAEALQSMWHAPKKIFFQLYEDVEKEKLLMDINVSKLVKSMQLDYDKLEDLLTRVFNNQFSENEVNLFFKELERINKIESVIQRTQALTTLMVDCKLKNLNFQKRDARERVQSHEVIQNGVLYQAIEESHKHKTIFILDEIDKANEEVDVLLLDFIQNGRVSDPSFGVKYANRKNLIFVMTSNEERELNKALPRRIRKVRMLYPTAEQQFKIIEMKSAPIIKRLGEHRIKNIIKISEAYRKKQPIIKSNPYSIYRSINDIDALIAKQSADSILNTLYSWFSHKEEDKKLLNKLKIDNLSIKKFIEKSIL